MNKTILFALVTATFAAAACTSDVEPEPSKAEIAQAIADGESVPDDVCASQGWNDDSICDSFCPDGDVSDCSGDDVVCAAFVEEANGVCDRPETDPCISQDPDCSAQICPAIAELPDGVCSEGPDEVCPTDPDCDNLVECPAIAELPDGVCNEDPNAICPTDPDCEQVACLAYVEESDGVCDRPESDPCRFQDPDCE
jgi:hypothetical protein